MNHRRPPRIQGFGYVGPRIYFLTVCTFRRSRWFEREDCASRTISALMRTSKDYGFALLTYCLMPDHLHCLVEGLRADSDCVKWIAMFKQRSVSVTPATMASGYGKRGISSACFDQKMTALESLPTSSRTPFVAVFVGR